MNIIVPMAGMGKRMRPHTLTVPKPLIPIAGKPIVQRLVEDIAAMSDEQIDHIAFVTGRFGAESEEMLLKVAKTLGAEGHICYQDEALGTAHAILCGQDYMQGKTIVAFADTLFRADFSLAQSTGDGVLWVKQIDNPEQFGVVQTNEEGAIVEFVEKPQTFVSDLAMIGVYFFKQGEVLREELQYLIDNNVMKGGEYQLPDALINMTKKGYRFFPGKVDDWMDCGNKNATVETNAHILDYIKDKETMIANDVQIKDSVIIEPCFIGAGAVIESSIIGPHVSVGAGTEVSQSIIRHSIVQSNTTIDGMNLDNAMIGHHARLTRKAVDASISDYSTYQS